MKKTGQYLLFPSSSPKDRISYMPVCGIALLFPLPALIRVIVTGPAAFAVLFVSCVQGSMSGHPPKREFPSLSAHHVHCPCSCCLPFVLFLSKLVTHQFSCFQLLSISDMMIKLGCWHYLETVITVSRGKVRGHSINCEIET